MCAGLNKKWGFSSLIGKKSANFCLIHFSFGDVTGILNSMHSGRFLPVDNNETGHPTKVHLLARNYT